MHEASPALQLIQAALDNRAYFYNIAFFSVAGWAFWRGAAPERSVAALMVASLVIGRFYRIILGNQFVLTQVDYFSFAQDATLAVVIVAIALRANRMYPLWIAGLQLISLQAHLARAVTPDIAPLAYVVMVVAPSYGQILALALGMRAHRKRLAIYGKYRSWRGSWPRLPGMKQTS